MARPPLEAPLPAEDVTALPDLLHLPDHLGCSLFWPLLCTLLPGASAAAGPAPPGASAARGRRKSGGKNKTPTRGETLTLRKRRNGRRNRNVHYELSNISIRYACPTSCICPTIWGARFCGPYFPLCCRVRPPLPDLRRPARGRRGSGTAAGAAAAAAAARRMRAARGLRAHAPR